MMKKVSFYFSLLLLSNSFLSCQKNDSARESVLAFGKVQFVNKSLILSDSISIIVDGKEIVASNVQVGNNVVSLLPASEHEFAVYSKGETPEMLLRGHFNVERNETRKVTLFRISDADSLSVVNINTDTVSVPANEYIKVSVANFTDHLPENVDISFIQQVNNRPVTMDTIATFENVKKDFSPFQEIRLRRNQANVLQYNFGLVLRDRDTKNVVPQTYVYRAKFTADAKIYAMYINSDRPNATVVRTAINAF